MPIAGKTDLRLDNKSPMNLDDPILRSVEAALLDCDGSCSFPLAGSERSPKSLAQSITIRHGGSVPRMGRESCMSKKSDLKSWSAKQAVAILAVDNIHTSDHGHELLKCIEDGHITHEQAKEEILRRARKMVSAAKESLDGAGGSI